MLIRIALGGALLLGVLGCGGTLTLRFSDNAVVDSKDAFHFARLTDLESACSGRWPGADIDSVGALGGGLVISLESSVLFDVDTYVLKPQAAEALRAAAQKLGEHPDARILVDGHTDSDGSTEHNLELSRNRAQAVRDSLVVRSDPP